MSGDVNSELVAGRRKDFDLDHRRSIFGRDNFWREIRCTRITNNLFFGSVETSLPGREVCQDLFFLTIFQTQIQYPYAPEGPKNFTQINFLPRPNRPPTTLIPPFLQCSINIEYLPRKIHRPTQNSPLNTTMNAVGCADQCS